MQEHLNEKIAAWREHGERFDCKHETTDLRRRTVKGGGVQYVHQCLRCGDPTNQPIAKAKAIESSGGVEPRAFDESIREAWEQLKTESAESINKRFSKDAFLADYEIYLQSDAWTKRRVLVMKRARGVCEGCGEQPATEVHHRTYKHGGNEFLFELVAVC